MTKKQLIRRIEQSKARIAKERDTLRELIDEVEIIEHDADEAVNRLDEAVDALSRFL